MFKTTKVAILASFFTSLLVNGIIYNVLRRPEIASVDILAITSQFIKKEAQKNHSSLEKNLVIKEFSHRLEQALNDLSRSKSLILVPREAVIKGSPDYTNVLMDRVGLESKS
ncbi:TrbI F-type domain-containing protein [Legionella bozemanae]|uniref:Type-F conjugative transfer system protein n=1 Tax=Legionella bozemanae TaxID=447 RepID=A0A0W0RQ25_LEGBO|nr:TrbI F-type domain-containing protein [Legionella bozemanae]KTC73161.1 type-F conjugative transfer system protein [Legionella bozemanae]STP14104.1 type-F conjugative transfer system protein TrbI [Legionella bozemanae]